MSNEVRIRVKADDQASATLKGVGASAVNLGDVMKFSVGGVGVAALGAFAKSAISAASSAEESANKVKVVFGSSAKGVEDFAKTASDNLGMSERAALAATGTFGNLFTSMGMAQAPAADMSKSIVQLAGDLSSFHDIPVAEALEKLRAGLVGESEPLRVLGVNLSEASLRQEALNLGLARGNEVLTPAIKAQAAYSQIMRETKNAQGDLDRTSDSLANKTRELTAKWDELQVALGKQAIPVVTESFKALIFVMEQFDKQASRHVLKDLIGDIEDLGKKMPAWRDLMNVPSLNDIFQGKKGGGKSPAEELREIAAAAAELVPQIDHVAVAWAKSVDAQVASITATANQKRATEEAYEAIRQKNDEVSQSIIADYDAARAATAFAAAERAAAVEADRLSKTLGGMVAQQFLDAKATQMQIQAKRIYNDLLGRQTDEQGNVIKSFRELVDEQIDSIKQSRLMAEVMKQANAEMGITEERAKGAARGLREVSAAAKEASTASSRPSYDHSVNWSKGGVVGAGGTTLYAGGGGGIMSGSQMGASNPNFRVDPKTGVTYIVNVAVAGSVLSDRDLAQKIRDLQSGGGFR